MNNGLGHTRPSRTKMVWGALLFIVGVAHAQGPPSLDHEIHFTTPITDAGVKYLYEGLTAQDPDIEIWVDRPTQSALARTIVHLDQSELQEAIAPSGLVIGYMGLLGTHPAEVNERSGTHAGDFPEYIDTGNAALDAANFLALKAAWYARQGAEPSPVPIAPD